MEIAVIHITVGCIEIIVAILLIAIVIKKGMNDEG
jgi:hypothetical protein